MKKTKSKENTGIILIFGFFIVVMAVLSLYKISLPSVVLFTLALIAFIFLTVKGLQKPEYVIYALVAYVPFSKILVGDFGGAMSAVNFTNILTILALVTWTISSVSTGSKFYSRTSLDIPLLLFIIFGCLSLVRGAVFFGSNYFIEYLVPLKRWITPMLLFFIVYNVIKDREKIKSVLVVMMFVLVIVALMAIKDYIDIGGSSSLEKSRVGGIAEQPNVLAAFFVYYMFLFAGLFLVYWRKFRYWLLVIPFLLCFRGIQVTFSRGGYLAFAAAVLAISFFKNKVLFLVIVIMLIIAAVNPVFLPPGIRYRMSSTFTQDQIYSSSLNENIDKSSATRLDIWKGSLGMIKEHLLFGVGYGVFPHLIPYYSPGVGERDAHNTYILIAAEMGILALLVFLSLLFVILKNSYKLYKITKDHFFKALALGFLGSLGGVLMANMFGGRLDSQEVSSYFWILAALIFRALYIERQKKKGTKKCLQI